VSINLGLILGIAVALIIIIVARRWDRRRHEDRLKVIQERIRRREAGGDAGADSPGDP
jgi:hypothetical protein